MKISAQVKKLAEMGMLDPIEMPTVDNTAEPSTVVPNKELLNLTIAKVVKDVGFLTKADRDLLRRKGYIIIAEDVEAEINLKGYLQGVKKALGGKFKGPQTSGILKAVNAVLTGL